MFKYIPRNMNGIFAIDKPSGVTSSKFLLDLQDLFTKSHVFEQHLQEFRDGRRAALSTDKKWKKEKIDKKIRNLKVKIGHGGTLDPLASGILVVGVGSGTKKLSHYLGECDKTYETKALLGISTTTGDSEGDILSKNKVDHITKEDVEKACAKFVGNIKQMPPIFSALKMNGKPLYEYAREGIPLPMPIKTRDVKVNSLAVLDDTMSTDHEFNKLETDLNPEEQNKLFHNETLLKTPLYFSDQYNETNEKTAEIAPPRVLEDGEQLPEKLPMIHFVTSVSSGTYIRSLIGDIGRALESSAYMVELRRTQQSDWKIGKNVFKWEDFAENDDRIWGPVLKAVLEQGHEVDVGKELEATREKMAPLIEEEKERLAKHGLEESSEQAPKKRKEETDEQKVAESEQKIDPPQES
ncbi:tRNA pseudouridine synthase 4 [Meyerozyma sp. JA9]|nr:tRNA pseudouridine synthase 4 [Meyerozyma sp. JA9]